MRTYSKWMGWLSVLSLLWIGGMPAQAQAQTKGIPEDPAVPHFITLESSGEGIFRGEATVSGVGQVITVDTAAAVDLPHASTLTLTATPDKGWLLKRLTVRETTAAAEEAELPLDAPAAFPDSHVFSFTLERNTVLHAYFERDVAAGDTIAVSEKDTVIGADGPVVLEHLEITGKTGSDTTTVVLKDVTVEHPDGGVASTLVTERSNVILELDGEVYLDKIENYGTLILRDEEGEPASLTFRTVENMGVFIDETGQVTEVAGSIAALSIKPLEDQQVTAGSSVTLTAEVSLQEGYHLTFLWERLSDGVWEQAAEPDVKIDEPSALRAGRTVTSQLTVPSSDAGHYRCTITNQVGEVISTLRTFAEVVLKSDPIPDPDPDPIPDPDPDPIPDPDPEIPTGVDSAENLPLTVWGTNGQLHVRSPKAQMAYIVTFGGRLVRTLDLPVGDTCVSLPKGLYLIRIGEEIYKIIL
ncbi:immunoglobulin domain-containing protein [Parabacteroides sp.]